MTRLWDHCYFLLQYIGLFVKSHVVHDFNLKLVNVGTVSPKFLSHVCLINNKWENCYNSSVTSQYNGHNTKIVRDHGELWQAPNKNYHSEIPAVLSGMYVLLPNTSQMNRSLYITKPMGISNLLLFNRIWRPKVQSVRTKEFSSSDPLTSKSNLLSHLRLPLNLKLGGINQSISYHGNVKNSKELPNINKTKLFEPENYKNTTTPTNIDTFFYNNMSLFEEFLKRLDLFERAFYLTTFNNLLRICPEDRRENGMSFVQSGLFLQMSLLALSTEVDGNTSAEIERSIGIFHDQTVKIKIIRKIMSSLPNSTNNLKFRRSSRLVLWPGRTLSRAFYAGAAGALRLHIDTFNGTETPDVIATTLNRMVEEDSGGAMRDTFDESEVSDKVDAVLLTTLYLRARWRSAPTLLNGTHPFHDTEYAPKRTVRMIRINDMMKYADLRDWNAEVLEISYSTPGLSLLMIVPRGRSLKELSEHLANAASLRTVVDGMRQTRVAATVPLYTLRMTLLLRNKLEAMGITRLMDVSDEARNGTLRLTHAIQRIMFWAEAGRNAFKDDGLVWDDPPELNIVVNKPYIFFVRWHNMTLMNGHFVL